MQNKSEENGADLHEIRTTISTLHESDALVELCAIGDGVIDSGYFDDNDALAQEAKRLSDSGIYDGIYITVNPVNPDLPKRRGLAKNRMYENVPSRTTDEDIARRRWFVLDVDPVRKPQTSATEWQKSAASWCKTIAVGSLRRELNMPDPVIADSGNGYYALYRTDEPNNREMDDLFRNATKAAAAKFSMKDVADIDPVTHNASRLLKLFGTMARKGLDNAKTPHRYSGLGGIPKKLRAVTRDQLEKLASGAPGPKKSAATNTSAVGTAAKVDEFLKRAAITVKSVEDSPDGSKKWVLVQCWFIPDHKDPAVFLYPDGVLAYRCFHRSCGQNKNRWKKFRQSVEKTIGERFDFAQGSDIQYESTTEGIVHHTYARGGEKVNKFLTNFSARILTNVIEDDGIEEKNVLEMEARCRQRSQRFCVSASDFPKMVWPIEKLGGEAIIAAGLGAKDHARAAIQQLSGDIERRTVYTHTGWRRIGGGWFYLHGDGAVGRDGLYDSVKVKLPQNLAAFRLPEPPAGEQLKNAVRASLRSLDIAPHSCTVPLFAAIWRSVLGASDFSVHATGPTGTFKTSVTALAMQHFGSGFDPAHLPGAWSSTANSNAAMQFTLKDALFLIDDFVPRGSRADVERLHRDADRIFRGQANNAGRGRLGRDGVSQRDANPPRSLTLSTGEDVPRGESLTSRVWRLGFSPGDVGVHGLTECQDDAAAGIYAEVMAAFLHYLAPLYASVKQSLPKYIEEYRAKATRDGQHNRTPAVTANLMIGIQYFLKFARHHEVLTKAEAQEICKDAWRSLLNCAAAQTRGQASEEPAQRFVDLIASALSSGDAVLANAETGYVPSGTRGRVIGWVAGDAVLLEPEAAFAAAQRLADQQGEGLPVGKQTMWKRLRERGFLARHGEGHNTAQYTVAGVRRRVLCIRKADVHLVSVANDAS
jgi:hypothetical protein